MRKNEAMSNYISEPNKHIEEYLDYYFDGKKNFQYAVLLNGAWGSGKTWFVKQYLEKKEDDERKICYVSLNGISRTSDIDELIFKNIHPILGSKGAKLAGQILKGTLKATIKVDLDGDSKLDGSASGSIPKIELPDYLKINDNFILVFDDLERCELKKEEVLGYINYFVEQDNIKTLIVSNEEEIKSNDDYSRKKEKLIGATFSYTEDQKLAIESIINEVTNVELKNFFNARLELIKQIFNQVGYKNLRSFKQTIFDFERFYKKDYFAPNENFDDELFEIFLKAFLILSLENKNGRFKKKVLEFKENDKEDTDYQTVENYSLGFIGSDANSFYKKYNLELREYIFSQELWDKILRENLIDGEKIKDELYKSYFRFKEEEPVWFKLWHYLDLEQEKFNELVKEAKLAIENQMLNNVLDVIHTFSMLVYLEDKNLIFFSVENLLDSAVKIFKDNVLIREDTQKMDESIIDAGSITYEYYAEKLPLFKKFLSRVDQAYKEKYTVKHTGLISELLLLMEQDKYEFRELMSARYYNYPILKWSDPTVFVETFLKIKYTNANIVIDTLEKRYVGFSSNKKVLEEKKWFESVVDLLEKRLTDTNALERHKISEKFLPKIREMRQKMNKSE